MRILIVIFALLIVMSNAVPVSGQDSVPGELVDLTVLTQKLPQKTMTGEEFGSSTFRYDMMTVYSLSVPGVTIPAEKIFRVLHFGKYTIGWNQAKATISYAEGNKVYMFKYEHGKMVECIVSLYYKDGNGNLRPTGDGNRFYPDDEGFIAKRNEANRILLDLKKRCDN